MFKVNDVFGEPVQLTEQVWEDIINKHPETVNLKEKIPLTLLHPEVVTMSIYNERVALYYRYFPEIFKGKFLVVVVKKLSAHEKYISTVYITDKRIGGELLWPRK